MGIAKTIIVGYSRTPAKKRKTIENGISVARFIVAYNKPHEPLAYLSCVAFADLADYVDTTLAKGDLVIVEGTLKQRYPKNQKNLAPGEKKTRMTEIVASSVEIIKVNHSEEIATNEDLDSGEIEELRGV